MRLLVTFITVLVTVLVFISTKMLVKNLHDHNDECHLESLKIDFTLKNNFLVRIKFSNLPTKTLECN